MAPSSYLRAADEQQPEPTGPTAQEMADRFAENGPCIEYQRFEDEIDSQMFAPARGQWPNIWQFIADAVGGTGGFANGNYLVRFQRESKNTGASFRRIVERIATAKYDNFARRIADAPWNRIIAHKDQVVRTSEDPRVLSFWQASDRRRTPIMNLMQQPIRQARMYGTGWLIVDRPAQPLRNRRADTDPKLAPYAYSVPTRNVVDWQFDDDYNLVALTIVEPPGSDDVCDDVRKCNLRVWTRDQYAVFEPLGKKGYVLADIAGPNPGPNPLGEVPAVQIFDGDPGPGRGFGITVMPQIARIARDVYNKDSEKRTLIRKCAAFMGIPVKDLESWLKKKIEIGEDVAVPYDTQSGGKPEWIGADLSSLVQIAQSIKDDKEAAFEASQMTAISGYLQTTSGFHSEAIFSETNTAIASVANSAEQGETRATRLTLRWHGEKDETLIDELFSIAYPTDYGIVDKDAVIARTEKRLDMELGAEDAEEQIFAMYVAENPRESKQTLRDRAKKAAAALYAEIAAGQAGTAVSTARGRLGLVPPTGDQPASGSGGAVRK